jgi:hypothetical protein
VLAATPILVVVTQSLEMHLIYPGKKSYGDELFIGLFLLLCNQTDHPMLLMVIRYQLRLDSVRLERPI